MAKRKKTTKKIATPKAPEVPRQIIERPDPDEKPVKLIDSLENKPDPAKLAKAKSLGCTFPPNVSDAQLDALIMVAELKSSMPPEAEVAQMAIVGKTKVGFYVRVDPSKAVRILEGKRENDRAEEIWETICVATPLGARKLFITKEKNYTELRLKYGGTAGPVIQAIEL